MLWQVVPANDFSPDSEDLTRCGASEEKASSLSSNGITDADFYVVITTELAGLCAGSGEGGETACAMDVRVQMLQSGGFRVILETLSRVV